MGRLALLSMCLLAAAPWAPGAARAQPPAFLPADPAAMLERLFGADTEEDRQALERVQVSPEEERQLGRAAVDGLLAELKRQKVVVATRGKDVQYLRDLVADLKPKMAHGQRYPTIDVYVVQSPLVEARAAPGGFLVFFRGLLDAAGSEAAVASVVAHELSHLDRGHQLQRAKGMKLAQQTLQRGAKQPSVPSPAEFLSMMRLWTRPFRPEDETAADGDAVRWTFDAGYDPRAMLDVLDAIERQKKGPPLPLPAFLQTHPAPETRRNAALALYRELTGDADDVKLYLGKENLRRRIPRSQREFPE